MSLRERAGSPLSRILLAAVGVGDRGATLVLHDLLLLTDHLGQIERFTIVKVSTGTLLTFASPHLTDVYVIDSTGDFGINHFDRVGYGWGRIMASLFDAGSVGGAVRDAVLD